MTKFFDRDDLGGKYRQISPNRYVWWFFADRKNGWCATIHDDDGYQIGEGEYDVDQFEAIIQAVKMMDKGENKMTKDEEHEYCTECDCILRWDESETLCKSCEERTEKEKSIKC